MSSVGKSGSVNLVSCKARMSGCRSRSQSNTRGRRTFRELTFQLAIFMNKNDSSILIYIMS